MATVVGAAPRGLRAALVRWRSELLLAAVVALVVVPVLQPLMAQQISRYALTASLVDDGSVAIEPYRHLIGVDRAERDGVLYSDKAPGQPVLGVPAYLAYRALGGPPGTQASGWADMGLWAVSLVSAALPAVLLAVLMRRLALRAAPRRATEAALALALGTMLLPFATVLFSHVLSALCGLAAYLVATRQPRRRGDLVAAGALAGAAVTVEYTMGLLVLLVGAVVLARGLRAGGAREALTAAGWYAAGGLPLALLLGWYHTAAFGGPLEVSYGYSQFSHHESGVLGVGAPALGMTLEVLFGERGLLVLTPVVLLGVVGAALLLRRRHARGDAVMALLVLAAFVWVMGSWSNPWAGASPGPRYVVPALPFLAAGVAAAWERWPAIATAAAAVGAFAMGLATFTLPLAQPSENALLAWLQRAREGGWADTLLTEAFGDWALVVPLLAALAVAVALFRGEARQRAVASDPPG